MIVRNEASNVKPFFDCVRGFVDYYVIVDTGSTDNTPKIIKEYTKGWLEGEVHVRQWEDFSTNRNQALDLARASGSKWALIMDADDELVGDKNVKLEDGFTYFITRKFGQMQWEVPNVLWLKDDWKWYHKVHEAVMCSSFKKQTLPNLSMNCDVRPGYRSTDTKKITDDIELLEKLVTANPLDSRSWFYIAQSHSTLGNADKAIAAFKKRADLGEWQEEVCVSNYMIARLRNMQGAHPDEIVHRLLSAHDASPFRAEPLYDLSFIYRVRFNNHQMAYPFARLASSKQLHGDFLFANTNIYLYGALHELALCCYFTGRREECNWACKILVERLDSVPEFDRKQVEGDIRLMTTGDNTVIDMLNAAVKRQSMLGTTGKV